MDPRSTIRTRPTAPPSSFPRVDVDTRTPYAELERVARNAPAIRDVAAQMLDTAKELRAGTRDLDKLTHGDERANSRAVRRATGALYDRVNVDVDDVEGSRNDVRSFNAALVLLSGRVRSETAASLSVRRLIQDLDDVSDALQSSIRVVDRTVDRVTFVPPPPLPTHAASSQAREPRIAPPTDEARDAARGNAVRPDPERSDSPRHRERAHRKHRRHRTREHHTTVITTTTTTREPACIVM